MCFSSFIIIYIIILLCIKLWILNSKPHLLFFFFKVFEKIDFDLNNRILGIKLIIIYEKLIKFKYHSVFFKCFAERKKNRKPQKGIFLFSSLFSAFNLYLTCYRMVSALILAFQRVFWTMWLFFLKKSMNFSILLEI